MYRFLKGDCWYNIVEGGKCMGRSYLLRNGLVGGIIFLFVGRIINKKLLQIQ